jgi:hypothetical protein
MRSMFRYASAFNHDISAWDLSAGTSIGERALAASFNLDLSAWDLWAVTGMRSMFRYASAFNHDISA